MDKKWRKLQRKHGKWRVVLINPMTGARREFEEHPRSGICRKYAELLVDASRRMKSGVYLVAEKMPER